MHRRELSVPPRPIYEKLFRAIVVMGAALGTSACTDGGKPSADARIADAGTDAHPIDGAPADVPVDVVAIL